MHREPIGHATASLSAWPHFLAGNIGAVSGVVGLAGGLAGFALPILFGVLADLTGVSSTCFMLLFGATAVSLVWMHFSFRPLRAPASPA